MSRLSRLPDKDPKVVVGLMSGTSVDGVDAALVEIAGRGLSTRVRLIRHGTFPYPGEIRERILRLFDGEVRDACEMNFVLGDEFARAAMGILREGETADLVGSHGQTIYHTDPSQPGRASTLQIGEASIIAEATGAVVVSDFRSRDISAGGTGAPLVPYADFLLFRQEGVVRGLQNIGGIANVTVVPDTLEGVFAFDTGPGNMVMDEVARAATSGRERFDPSGSLAAAGKVDDALLGDLLGHPFLGLDPPKSTGREVFGKAFADELIRDCDEGRLGDLLATVTRFTARSIHLAYERFVFPRTRIDEVWTSGGGVLNETLMSALRDLFAPLPVRNLDDVSPIPASAKEAVAFAVLANEAVHGCPANLPRVTGASWPVVLGKIVP